MQQRRYQPISSFGASSSQHRQHADPADRWNNASPLRPSSVGSSASTYADHSPSVTRPQQQRLGWNGAHVVDTFNTVGSTVGSGGGLRSSQSYVSEASSSRGVPMMARNSSAVGGAGQQYYQGSLARDSRLSSSSMGGERPASSFVPQQQQPTYGIDLSRQRRSEPNYATIQQQQQQLRMATPTSPRDPSTNYYSANPSYNGNNISNQTYGSSSSRQQRPIASPTSPSRRPPPTVPPQVAASVASTPRSRDPSSPPRVVTVSASAVPTSRPSSVNNDSRNASSPRAPTPPLPLRGVNSDNGRVVQRGNEQVASNAPATPRDRPDALSMWPSSSPLMMSSAVSSPLRPPTRVPLRCLTPRSDPAASPTVPRDRPPQTPRDNNSSFASNLAAPLPPPSPSRGPSSHSKSGDSGSISVPTTRPPPIVFGNTASRDASPRRSPLPQGGALPPPAVPTTRSVPNTTAGGSPRDRDDYGTPAASPFRAPNKHEGPADPLLGSGSGSYGGYHDDNDGVIDARERSPTTPSRRVEQQHYGVQAATGSSASHPHSSPSPSRADHTGGASSPFTSPYAALLRERRAERRGMESLMTMSSSAADGVEKQQHTTSSVNATGNSGYVGMGWSGMQKAETVAQQQQPVRMMAHEEERRHGGAEEDGDEEEAEEQLPQSPKAALHATQQQHAPVNTSLRRSSMGISSVGTTTRNNSVTPVGYGGALDDDERTPHHPRGASQPKAEGHRHSQQGGGFGPIENESANNYQQQQQGNAQQADEIAELRRQLLALKDEVAAKKMASVVAVEQQSDTPTSPLGARQVSTRDGSPVGNSVEDFPRVVSTRAPASSVAVTASAAGPHTIPPPPTVEYEDALAAAMKARAMDLVHRRTGTTPQLSYHNNCSDDAVVGMKAANVGGPAMAAPTPSGMLSPRQPSTHQLSDVSQPTAASIHPEHDAVEAADEARRLRQQMVADATQEQFASPKAVLLAQHHYAADHRYVTPQAYPRSVHSITNAHATDDSKGGGGITEAYRDNQNPTIANTDTVTVETLNQRIEAMGAIAPPQHVASPNGPSAIAILRGYGGIAPPPQTAAPSSAPAAPPPPQLSREAVIASVMNDGDSALSTAAVAQQPPAAGDSQQLAPPIPHSQAAEDYDGLAGAYAKVLSIRKQQQKAPAQPVSNQGQLPANMVFEHSGVPSSPWKRDQPHNHEGAHHGAVTTHTQQPPTFAQAAAHNYALSHSVEVPTTYDRNVAMLRQQFASFARKESNTDAYAMGPSASRRQQEQAGQQQQQQPMHVAMAPSEESIVVEVDRYATVGQPPLPRHAYADQHAPSVLMQPQHNEGAPNIAERRQRLRAMVSDYDNASIIPPAIDHHQIATGATDLSAYGHSLNASTTAPTKQQQRAPSPGRDGSSNNNPTLVAVDMSPIPDPRAPSSAAAANGYNRAQSIHIEEDTTTAVSNSFAAPNGARLREQQYFADPSAVKAFLRTNVNAVRYAAGDADGSLSSAMSGVPSAPPRVVAADSAFNAYSYHRGPALVLQPNGGKGLLPADGLMSAGSTTAATTHQLGLSGSSMAALPPRAYSRDATESFFRQTNTHQASDLGTHTATTAAAGTRNGVPVDPSSEVFIRQARQYRNEASLRQQMSETSYQRLYPNPNVSAAGGINSVNGAIPIKEGFVRARQPPSMGLGQVTTDADGQQPSFAPSAFFEGANRDYFAANILPAEPPVEEEGLKASPTRTRQLRVFATERERTSLQQHTPIVKGPQPTVSTAAEPMPHYKAWVMGGRTTAADGAAVTNTSTYAASSATNLSAMAVPPSAVKHAPFNTSIASTAPYMGTSRTDPW